MNTEWCCPKCGLWNEVEGDELPYCDGEEMEYDCAECGQIITIEGHCHWYFDYKVKLAGIEYDVSDDGDEWEEACKILNPE